MNENGEEGENALAACPAARGQAQSIRDAVLRVRARRPPDPGELARNRDAQDIVSLNLLVAIQETLSLAAHSVADEGRDVPQSYRAVMLALADAGAVSRPLAERLASAAGRRNLIAHQYAALDWGRVHLVATESVSDLEAFCAELSARLLD